MRNYGLTIQDGLLWNVKIIPTNYMPNHVFDNKYWNIQCFDIFYWTMLVCLGGNRGSLMHTLYCISERETTRTYAIGAHQTNKLLAILSPKAGSLRNRIHNRHFFALLKIMIKESLLFFLRLFLEGFYFLCPCFIFAFLFVFKYISHVRFIFIL